jgi:hypothetical protein
MFLRGQNEQDERELVDLHGVDKSMWTLPFADLSFWMLWFDCSIRNKSHEKHRPLSWCFCEFPDL